MRQVSELVKNNDLVTLPPNSTVQQACALMRDQRIGAILIVEKENLVGIFTARDAAGRVIAEGLDPAATKLADVMTKSLDTPAAGKAAIEALRMMQDGGYRHLPVVEDGKLRGIVSKGDFSGREYESLQEETVLWETTC